MPDFRVGDIVFYMPTNYLDANRFVGLVVNLDQGNQRKAIVIWYTKGAAHKEGRTSVHTRRDIDIIGHVSSLTSGFPVVEVCYA